MRVERLTEEQVELVDSYLPLSRLETWHERHGVGGSDYLIAWDGDVPVGHAHVAWPDCPNELPEVQDVFVPEQQRRRGVARAVTAAAEDEAAARGFDRMSLSVGEGNAAARALYERMGYEYTGLSSRVQATIMIRGEPLEVDETLLYLEKELTPRPPA